MDWISSFNELFEKEEIEAPDFVKVTEYKRRYNRKTKQRDVTTTTKKVIKWKKFRSAEKIKKLLEIACGFASYIKNKERNFVGPSLLEI